MRIRIVRMFTKVLAKNIKDVSGKNTNIAAAVELFELGNHINMR